MAKPAVEDLAMLMRTAIKRAICASIAVVGSVHADGTPSTPDLELGEYLAAECMTCHRANAVNAGIPNIVGVPAVLFRQAMQQYRDGVRNNQAMQNVARSLTNEDVAALAAYFEQSRK